MASGVKCTTTGMDLSAARAPVDIPFGGRNHERGVRHVQTRRTVILGGAAAIAAIPTFGYLRRQFAPLPEFEAIADPAGFRRLPTGPVSTAGTQWIGLDTASDRTVPRLEMEAVRTDPCAALHDAGGIAGGTVPIASFSDYYCTFCRVQTARLADLQREMGDDLAITWHELPLLGPSSDLAARAALAARRQGAYIGFHERLLSSPFQATPAYLSALSEDLGVDHDRLIADMESDAVRTELGRSAAIADLFGFVGTPAMVVGRTVISGRVPEGTLRKVIALERAEGWKEAC